MKSGPITSGRMLIAICVAAISFALVSWDHKQSPGGSPAKQQLNDTIPPKKDKKVRDLDEAIAELEAVDLKIELDKAMEEVNKALKELDVEKIHLDVEKAMKDVDFDKIKTDVEKAMKEVDFAKMEKDVQESLAKIDWNKIKAELDEVKNIDLSKMEVELTQAKEELKNIGPKLEKELKNAKIEIEKAKTEMKEFKSFVDGLDKEGLINKQDAYSIKYKEGKLTINDKDASAETYKKYGSFLDKHKKFTIEKDNEDFNIDMD
jgi:hypothetical protein